MCNLQLMTLETLGKKENKAMLHLNLACLVQQCSSHITISPRIHKRAPKRELRNLKKKNTLPLHKKRKIKLRKVNMPEV